MKISQKIIDYSIWYYLKYFPSKNKLKQKLLEKFGKDSENGKKYGGIGDDEISFIFNENMKNIFCEEDILEGKIRNFLAKNKNLNYIKNNLFQKLFDRKMINEILENKFLEEGKSLLNENILRQKILELKNRNKSKNHIKNKFYERKEDLFLIENLLKEIFENGEKDGLRKEFEKIKDRFERKKIVSRLLGKGFYYKEILEILDENM